MRIIPTLPEGQRDRDRFLTPHPHRSAEAMPADARAIIEAIQKADRREFGRKLGHDYPTHRTFKLS